MTTDRSKSGERIFISDLLSLKLEGIVGKLERRLELSRKDIDVLITVDTLLGSIARCRSCISRPKQLSINCTYYCYECLHEQIEAGDLVPSEICIRGQICPQCEAQTMLEISDREWYCITCREEFSGNGD
jgi:hypothetical protein